MLGYFVLTALIPCLDSPRFESGWGSYWRRGPVKRLLPLLLVATVGTVPLMAQTPITPPTPAGTPSFDFNAWMQRAEAKVQDEWEFIWDEDTSAQAELRELVLGYSAYKQARAICTRLMGANFTINFASCLPYLEMQTDLGNGQTEDLKVTPIFNDADRTGINWNGPKIKLAPFKLSNFDFDVDRSVAFDGSDPTDGKSLDTLKQQASDDGWLSWSRAQKTAQIGSAYQAMPGGFGYSVSNDVQDFYNQRTQSLYQILATALRNCGPDSAQYQLAKTNYEDWNTLLSTGQADADAAIILAQLTDLDSQAARERIFYSANNIQMLMAQQRAAAADKHVKQIALMYDSKGACAGLGIGQFMDIATMFTRLTSTLDAMGGDPADPYSPPKEPQGNAMKANVFSRWIADSNDQSLKLASLKNQQEAQGKMLDIARAKAQVINDAAAKRQTILGQDAVAVLAAQQTKLLHQMGLMAMSLLLPWGTVPIVPATDAADQTIHGADGTPAVGPDQADVATTQNLQKLGSTAVVQTSTDVGSAVVATGTKLSWGVLSPIAKAFDAGAKAVLGYSFNLSNWTES